MGKRLSRLRASTAGTDKGENHCENLAPCPVQDISQRDDLCGERSIWGYMSPAGKHVTTHRARRTVAREQMAHNL